MDLENTHSYKNGIFGIACNYEQASLILLPVPWEVTASYGSGAALGPEAILKASPQIDLYDIDFGEFIEKGIYWDQEFLNTSGVLELNLKYKPLAQKIQDFLEDNDTLTDELIILQNEVNQASEQLNQLVLLRAQVHLKQNKSIGLIGGDHSSPYGLIKALNSHHGPFGILHIDAHADLRVRYQGFTHSHASIFSNVMELQPEISSLVQVGVRDFCKSEFQKVKDSKNIHCFFDQEIKNHLFKGNNWSDQCDQIIKLLPDKIYISFDIDGLSPDLCPSTGKPVPGGLSFEMMSSLLKKIKDHNKKVVGFDLCEVAPGVDSTWDANVGARVLFKLCGTMLA
jgi:agmatinase